METEPSAASARMQRPMKLFERLLDSDVKADLLTLFHNNPHLAETIEDIAKRIGRTPSEVQREFDDLVQLGIMRKTEVYSLGLERDEEIQDAISKQLALGEAAGLEEHLEGLLPGSAAQMAKINTGLDFLDKLLPDGLPAVCTIMVLSDPSAGEESLLAHLVSQRLQETKLVLYVTLDNFPANVRHIVQSQITKGPVDWEYLAFVDCYSNTVGVESEEVHVADPEHLTEIGIAISDVMSARSISLIVLDSFNTLIRKRGYRSAIEFLRVLVARTRQARCLCLVTMNRKAFHPAMVASAQDIVDGVIELKAEESSEGLARSLRVPRLVGMKHLTTWVPYEISDDGKFVPVTRST
jgi:KaiC/GvpD/RAD55 family RecA-like ATPase/AraC-like DNA-binding protein